MNAIRNIYLRCIFRFPLHLYCDFRNCRPHLCLNVIFNVIFLHPVARSLIQYFSSVFVRHFYLLNCLKHFKTLKHLMFIHYMFRSIRPSSGVKIVVRGSCCVLVFLMVVYCNLGSFPVFVCLLQYVLPCCVFVGYCLLTQL
jgi:hypothetical protein